MTHARHRPSGRSRALRTAAAATCLVALLGACDLRLQTPAPTAPSPGATETARQRAASEAVALADLARLAAEGTSPAGAGTGVVEALDEVVTTSGRQAAALGGVYVPWSTSPSAVPSTAGPSAGPAPAPTPTEVVTALRAAAEQDTRDAETVADGPLARLLASVAAGRTVLADALDARLTGTPLSLPVALPAPEPSTAPPAAPAAAPAAPSGAGSRGAVPGVQDSSLTALLEAQDALGAGWEVLAARSRGEDRTRASLVAAAHRADAQTWATTLGVDGTALDPRRDAYALPTAVLEPGADAMAALVALEAQLGTRYATLVGQAEPGSRGPFVRALVANAVLVLRASGTATAFPGVGDTAGTTPTSGPTG